MKTSCTVAKPFRYGGEMREVGETVEIETRFVRALSGLGKIEAKKKRGRPPKVKEEAPVEEVAVETAEISDAEVEAAFEPATYSTKDMKAQ